MPPMVEASTSLQPGPPPGLPSGLVSTPPVPKEDRDRKEQPSSQHEPPARRMEVDENYDDDEGDDEKKPVGTQKGGSPGGNGAGNGIVNGGPPPPQSKSDVAS